MPKIVQFYRNFRRFTGGHLKMADIIDHVRASPAYQVRIFVAPGSAPDHPWQNDPDLTDGFAPDAADVLVLGGSDWTAVPDGTEDRVAVVNLIQGLGHAAPGDPRHAFLARRADRVCVSTGVRQALAATGRCNGPLHDLPFGLRTSDLPVPADRSVDVFIAGLKCPGTAQALAVLLRAHGLSVDCQTTQVPRDAFLKRMASARIAVTLPLPQEGFFLPALEAMAMGCLVVCPDGVGNRDFCIDGQTCLMPLAEPGALAAAVQRLRADAMLAAHLLQGGRRMVEAHGLEAERRAVLRILNGISPRNIILTGLPRSGTTLVCNLLGALPNVVALHEPMSPPALAAAGPDFVAHVVAFFDRQRHLILTEGRAVSKASAGRVPRNPLTDEVVDGARRPALDGREISVTNVDRRSFDLCIKHPAMFTARLPELSRVFDCYATVRNPLSVLLSWRDSGMAVANGHAPAAERLDPDLANRLRQLPDVLDRQVCLLDYSFARYRDHLPDRTLRYEDVVASGGAALASIIPAAASLSEPLLSRNARKLGLDPQVQTIARRLLATDHACWAFYDRSDVEALAG